MEKYYESKKFKDRLKESFYNEKFNIPTQMLIDYLLLYSLSENIWREEIFAIRLILEKRGVKF
jgi:hypothetical protein